jgi:diguanylate cyclase (GGDEF)-like protein/PAS domain S-box-containing protein
MKDCSIREVGYIIYVKRANPDNIYADKRTEYCRWLELFFYSIIIDSICFFIKGISKFYKLVYNYLMKNFNKFFNKRNNNTINAVVDSLSRTRLDIEEQYRTICELSKDAVIVLDTKGKMLYCNPVYFSYSGYSQEEIIGKHFLKIQALIYSELPQILRAFFKLLRGEKVSGFEFKFKMKTGQIRIGEAEMAPLYSNRKIVGVLGLIRDVTDQKTALNSLKLSRQDHVFASAADITEGKQISTKIRESQEYAAEVTEEIRIQEELKLKDSAIESSMNAIAILDLGYRIIYANESFVKIFGYKNKNDVTGREATEFIVVDDSFQLASTALFESSSVFGEFKGIKPNGTIFDIEQYANLVINDGKPLAIMVLVIDITARKKEAERIKYLSFHDGLTKLYNRAYFEEELKRLDTPRQLPLSFIIGDLNSLKLVNDSYGHRFGDAMIVRAAKIIKKYCRDEDVIARWGGDEFVILLPRADKETAESIIERIRKACEAYTYKKIPLSIALGNASKVSQDESMNLIIKDAEENMYRRKLLERKSISGSIILSLEATLSAKSFETKEHTERLKKHAIKLGKKLNFPENQIGELSLLAALHDIGKVAIPESILAKEGQLNKKEWELIKRHPEIGSNIAKSSPQISHIADAILAAHENWDGSGYPKGLQGEDIPVISRIVHIIDTFDVMRNGRPYKKLLNKATAIKELRACAGVQFDPVLVEEFISMVER